MSEKIFLEKTISPERFPIKIKTLRISENSPSVFPYHWHEHIELLFIFEGSCIISYGSETMNAVKNDLAVINCNELHSTQASDDSVIFCMQISRSFFSDTDFDSLLFKSHIKNNNTIKELFTRIFKENEEQKEAYRMQIKGLTYLLMTQLMRNYSLKKEDIPIKRTKLLKINAVLRYITTHYQTQITTADLAKKFFLSEYYFCHFFKSETGMTPLSYINKFRIEKAIMHIKTTNESITQIALMVGFQDSNYFSKIFKKYKGMSPREYRKSFKER